jgi:hypothetical protein
MVTPTLDLLATIINTIYCELALGRTASVWMLSGMANRYVQTSFARHLSCSLNPAVVLDLRIQNRSRAPAYDSISRKRRRLATNNSRNPSPTHVGMFLHRRGMHAAFT